MQADLYYNRLLKPVKQVFLCRTLYEPRHEKTSVLHLRKQRRRSASR